MSSIANNNIKAVLALLVFLTIPILGNTQIIPSKSNLSYLLDPHANINLTHKVITKNDKKWIVLEIKSRYKTNLDSLNVAFAFTNNLDEPISSFSLVKLESFELTKTTDSRSYAFEASKKDTGFLVLRIASKELDEIYSYIINLDAFSSFIISESKITIPIIKPYTSVLSNLKLAKLTGELSTFNAKFYTTKFSPSLPPMASLQSKNSLGEADTTYTITLATGTEGLYAIGTSTNKKPLSYFRIVSKKYPHLASIDEIIEASIFLFTKKEKKKIVNSSNPKQEYDAFWLENTGSSDRARKMISAYFQRVKESNQLFTSFKQGWKTDMGMIYIIFGPPSKVFRSDKGIEWVYKKTYELPNLNFEFDLKEGDFDTEIFELQRNLAYQNSWFRAIDLWRKGRKNL